MIDWIPIKDNLPPFGERVLLCNKHTCFFGHLSFVDHEGPHFYDLRTTSAEVKAWSKVPEVYKE